MWAIVSTFAFGWFWDIKELITTPKYWFIPCIMIYYMFFYFIKTYFLKHLKIIVFLTSILIIIFDYFFLDHSKSLMYADTNYMKLYFFSFMLLGAITATKQDTKFPIWKSTLNILICLLVYYGCMALYKIDSFYCNFQIISLLPLLGIIYWLYKFCNTEKVYSILNKKYIGKGIKIISSLTLEIYLVQYAIFTDKLNFLFPLNIIIIYCLIFITAYALRCFSNLFSAVFSQETINIKSIFKIDL